jgi:hypothetical protein
VRVGKRGHLTAKKAAEVEIQEILYPAIHRGQVIAQQAILLPHVRQYRCAHRKELEITQLSENRLTQGSQFKVEILDHFAGIRGFRPAETGGHCFTLHVVFQLVSWRIARDETQHSSPCQFMLSSNHWLLFRNSRRFCNAKTIALEKLKGGIGQTGSSL